MKSDRCSHIPDLDHQAAIRLASAPRHARVVGNLVTADLAQPLNDAALQNGERLAHLIGQECPVARAAFIEPQPYCWLDEHTLRRQKLGMEM